MDDTKSMKSPDNSRDYISSVEPRPLQSRGNPRNYSQTPRMAVPPKPPPKPPRTFATLGIQRKEKEEDQYEEINYETTEDIPKSKERSNTLQLHPSKDRQQVEQGCTTCSSETTKPLIVRRHTVDESSKPVPTPKPRLNVRSSCPSFRSAVPSSQNATDLDVSHVSETETATTKGTCIVTDENQRFYEMVTNESIATEETRVYETATIQSKSKTTAEGQVSDTTINQTTHEAQDETYFVKSSYRYVIAIDLGTTYSGYAYSSFTQFNRDPLDVVIPRWNDGSFLSLKTATCVLYSPDKKFDSFGYDAESKYYELTENDPIDAQKWILFKHFKMELYKQEIVMDSMTIHDNQGRSMLGLTVFSDSIRYLKKKAMEDINHVECDVIEDDCRWVLTVPAIWNDDARKFMIKAAFQAGIHTDDLLLSLEPEAAGVLCKEVQVQMYYRKKANDLLAFNLGSKFVVVDLGGGTVDITTNEVLKNGMIKELQSATGGDCGGTRVDNYFIDFLRKVLEVEDLEKFERNNRCDFIDLYRSFEIKKRQFDSRKTEQVMLQIPPLISSKFIKGKINERITMVRDKLRIPKLIFQSLFTFSIDSILNCLRDIITEEMEINTILVVGGFSGCQEVRYAIKEAFPKQYLICPPDAELAVLKGAVIFGHNPAVISSRVSKFWYGIKLPPEIKPPESSAGDFFLLISKGQHVKIGEKMTCRFYVRDDFNGDKIELYQILSSNETVPLQSNDSGCVKNDIPLNVSVPAPHENMKRVIRLIVRFRGTELEYSASVTSKLAPTKVSVQVK